MSGKHRQNRLQSVARGEGEKRQLAPSPDSTRLNGLRETGNAGDLSLVSSFIFLGEIPRSFPGPAGKIILPSADSGEKGMGIPGGGRQSLLRSLNVSRRGGVRGVFFIR